MPLVPLKLPPGMVYRGTSYQSKGRWRGGNLVRWVEGIMRPIGTWRKIVPTPFSGRITCLLTFFDNRSFPHTAVGASGKLHVISANAVADITPAGFSAGPDSTLAGVGYGSGDYSDDTYGDARGTSSTGLMRLPAVWTMDNWGEYLMALSSYDGTPYVWRPATTSTPADSEAQAVPNAPVNCTAVLVTQERHLCVIGADGDAQTVAWSDREDYTTWTSTAANLAGRITVQTSGRLLRGVKVGPEIFILGDTDVFTMRYIGAPLAYGIEPAGTNCGVIGPNAVAVADDFVVWMSRGGFYMYDGTVKPLACDVYDWVYRELDAFQGYQIAAGHNPEFSEVWWWTPTVSSAGKNVRYAAWNYRSNIWTIGEMARSAWEAPRAGAKGLAAGEDGNLFEHEVDLSELGEPRGAPYAESAPFEIGSGDAVVSILGLIPDQDALALNALQYEFVSRFTPRGTPRSYGPYYPDEDGYTDTRFQGRQVTLRVVANEDIDWRLGTLRAKVVIGGAR